MRHSTAVEVLPLPCVVLCWRFEPPTCWAALVYSSVGGALMPGKQGVVGSNPTQRSSFFLEKIVAVGVIKLFAFALHITS